MKEATTHSGICHELWDKEGLSAAIEYCKQQGIVPPNPSPAFTAQHHMSEQCSVAALLSDYGWWAKRLKLKAAREHSQ